MVTLGPFPLFPPPSVGDGSPDSDSSSSHDVSTAAQHAEGSAHSAAADGDDDSGLRQLGLPLLPLLPYSHFVYVCRKRASSRRE